jgi:hypothetical protein
MIIVGAGLAGLIAGHVFSRFNPVLFEAQQELPNNHHALLRFRSDAVEKATSVPFTKALVRKEVICDGVLLDRVNANVANRYSLKVTGDVEDRSIWNTEIGYRYIAPPDLVSRLAAPLRIRYGFTLGNGDGLKQLGEIGPVVSTIPMPRMMDIVGWKEKPDFKWRPIWSIQVKVVAPKISVHQTIHYPDAETAPYRASIVGNTLVVEFADEPEDPEAQVKKVLYDFGLESCVYDPEPVVKRQDFGKIVPSDPQICRAFIHMLTQDYNCFSLGRFATWRQLLLDDVVHDCAVIARLIEARQTLDAYHASLRTAAPARA